MKIALLPNNGNLQQNGYSLEEQAEVYDYQLEEILLRTRWYLDNLEIMRPYRVQWNDYRTKTATLPHRFVKKRNAL